MNEILKMDVFFFVTTIAVVLCGSLCVYALWQVSRVLAHIEHISGQVSLESDSIRADLAGVRADIRRGKGRLKSLFDFFGTRVKRASKKA
ncbi:MAG: hypothetical protein WC217_01925 [Candidatus Paceibacterota bacterium]|jgi:hypothetical protein